MKNLQSIALFGVSCAVTMLAALVYLRSDLAGNALLLFWAALPAVVVLRKGGKAPLIAGIVVGLWMTGIVWGQGYASPLYRAWMSAGIAKQDQLFFASIGSMIRNYGVVSTGLDGLPPTPYHFFSQAVAAGYARVFGVPLLDVYHLVFPILLPVLMLSAFLLMVVALRPALSLHRGLFWLCFTVGIIGLVPQPVAEQFGGWQSSIISESNAMAFTIVFALAAVVICGGWRKPWMVLAVLPMACFIVGITKQSTLLLAVAGMGWLFLRLRLYCWGMYNVSAVLVVGASAAAYLVTRGTFESAPIDPGSFFRNYVYGAPLVWFLLMYGWSGCYVYWTWFFQRQQLGFIKSFLYTLTNRHSMKAELLIVISVVGLIPTMVLDIGGGSGFYFLDLQRYLAIAFLLTVIPAWTHRTVGFRTLTTAAITLVSLNVLYSVGLLLFYNQVVPRGPDAPAVAQLFALAQTDEAVKSVSGVLIDQNHPYWSMMGDRCQTVPFLVPAVTEMTAIHGLPDSSCLKASNFGYQSYPPESGEVCDRAREYGLVQIFILSNSDEITILQC